MQLLLVLLGPNPIPNPPTDSKSAKVLVLKREAGDRKLENDAEGGLRREEQGGKGGIYRRESSEACEPHVAIFLSDDKGKQNALA
jgi:hypothetical protein